jgi:hypothetical protein
MQETDGSAETQNLNIAPKYLFKRSPESDFSLTGTSKKE